MVPVTVLPGVIRCDVAAGAGMWCPSVLSGAAPPPPHRPGCTVPNAPQGAYAPGCCFILQLWQLDLVTPFWGAEEQKQKAEGAGVAVGAWHPATTCPALPTPMAPMPDPSLALTLRFLVLRPRAGC